MNPPPTYVASRPQILVAPLSDSASFFHNDEVQGEIFVKGLGEPSSRRTVRQLHAELMLVNKAPELPDAMIWQSGPRTLWSSSYHPTGTSASTSSPPPFPSIHRFAIPLRSALGDDHLNQTAFGGRYTPGTLDLSLVNKGKIEWTLRITMDLDGETFTEEVKVEGTPRVQEPIGSPTEVYTTLERGGVRTRLLASDRAPRLGSLLHVGLEMRAMERKKTGVAGLSSQPDPGATLRGLRRVRVELYRLVRLRSPSSEASSSRDPPTTEIQHLTLLYASGKSLRFPGINNLPLRVMFTLPTTQTGATADGSWGEVSMNTPYHDVSFFVRATFGFGALGEAAPRELQDWVLQQDIQIRPKAFEYAAAPGPADEGDIAGSSSAAMNDEDLAKEAYRQKGLDIVGTGGTFRAEELDQPPEFEAGPSHASQAPGLPSFTESEAIAAVGQAPFPRATVVEQDMGGREARVGRPESLGGELATWVEYDGYETFSMAPPALSASYGVSGPVDPPQPDDENSGVAPNFDARMDMAHGGSLARMEFMQSLGLGRGAVVADMQDDLPPGIDEPSLPALPSFDTSQRSAQEYNHGPALSTVAHDMPPPSFAASQAVGAAPPSGGQAVTASDHTGQGREARVELEHHADRQEPPGYFGASGSSAGPPAYS